MSNWGKPAVVAAGLLAAGIAGAIALSKYAESNVHRRYRDRLHSRLLDPDAAQYRHEKFVTNSAGKALCGEINAKNGFGAYRGFRAFIVSDTEVIVAPDDYGDRNSADDLQTQIDFLEALRRHCYTDAEIADAERHRPGQQ